jgi:hypothetical protein
MQDGIAQNNNAKAFNFRTSLSESIVASTSRTWAFLLAGSLQERRAVLVCVEVSLLFVPSLSW